MLEQARPANRSTGHGVSHLLEDPRIADRAAGDADSVEARVSDHLDAGGRREQVAAAQHDVITRVPFESARMSQLLGPIRAARRSGRAR